MDIKSPGYFGRLEVSGIAMPNEATGSVLEILTRLTADLRQLTPRITHGAKTLTITISSQPITSESIESSTRATSIMTGIDDSLTTRELPHQTETLEEHINRLIADNYPEETARYLAHDAAGIPYDNSDFIAWSTNSRAIRWRQLNASEHAADSADPEEYAWLKGYCKTRYPSYYAAMRVWR